MHQYKHATAHYSRYRQHPAHNGIHCHTGSDKHTEKWWDHLNNENPYNLGLVLFDNH